MTTQFSSIGIDSPLGTWVVHRTGDRGPWVVCWPSIMGDHRGMLEFAALLSDKYRVALIDPPGFFANQQMTQWPAPHDMAQLALGLCDALGATQFHWVGHGFGGLVGAAIAQTQGHRLRSLTLSSTPLIESARVSLFSKTMARLLYRTRWGRRVVTSKVCKQMVTQGTEERLQVEQHVGASLEACNVSVLTALEPASSNQAASFLRVLRSSQVPKLVIAGDKDNFCLCRHQKTAAELMPVTHYTELSCGFMTFLVRPEQCAAVFTSFLRYIR